MVIRKDRDKTATAGAGSRMSSFMQRFPGLGHLTLTSRT